MGLEAMIVACIHDSIWVEALGDREPEVRRIMTKVMPEAGKMDVPLEADFD